MSCRLPWGAFLNDWKTRTRVQQNVKPETNPIKSKIDGKLTLMANKFRTEYDVCRGASSSKTCAKRCDFELEPTYSYGNISGSHNWSISKHAATTWPTCQHIYSNHHQRAAEIEKNQGLGELFDCILIAATIKVTSKDNHVLRSLTCKWMPFWLMILTTHPDKTHRKLEATCCRQSFFGLLVLVHGIDLGNGWFLLCFLHLFLKKTHEERGTEQNVLTSYRKKFKLISTETPPWNLEHHAVQKMAMTLGYPR